MPKFGEIALNFKRIDFNKIYVKVFSEKNIQDWVISTIQKRIYLTGVDGKGNKLKTDKSDKFYYSNRTMDIKSYFGQKVSNVTLKDSGEFYSSMKIILLNAGFQIDADFEKQNGNMYKNFTQSYSSQKEFANDVMSLNQNELNYIVKEKAIPLIIKELKNIL